MKKIFIGMLIGVIISSAGYAENAFNKIKIKVNGTDTPTENVLIDGRTYVSLRSLSTIFGKNIEWDGKTSTANITDKADLDLFERYLTDVETQTNRKINEAQKSLLIDYIKNNSIAELDKPTLSQRREEFDKTKNKLIIDWEKNTNQKWPVYEQDVLNEKGKILRKKGNKYDAHHIVELSNSGKNVWWNLHPAKFPDEHQGGIHRKDGLANKLFVGES